MKEWEARLDRIEAILESTAERQEAAEKWLEDYKKENKEAFDKLRWNISGISDSNGMVAEDYFFESLKKTKALGGVHFDIVLRYMTNALKLEDGTILNDEYDTVMINDDAVCVIEVKYKVEKQDINRLAKKRVHNFKKLFPMYANYKIYLAFGGLTFQKGAVDVAKELGMGVLRLSGDAVEVDDANLKAY